MSFLKWFKSDEPVVAYQEYEVETSIPETAIPFDTKEMTLGSWVMTPEGVGVLTVEGVELAQEDGTRKMIIVEDKAVPHVVTEVYRKAYIEEIPTSRVGIAYSLGYESKPQ